MRVLSLVIGAAYCTATYKFRLSNGRQNFAALSTTYTEVTDTWLSPTIYLKHDKLPGFVDYLMAFAPAMYSGSQDSQDSTDIEAEEEDEAGHVDKSQQEEQLFMSKLRAFTEVVAGKVEAYRQRVIDVLIDTKEKPTLKSLGTLIADLNDLKFSVYRRDDQMSRCVLSVLDSFVVPDLRVWLSGNDMDGDIPPLTFLEHDDETPLIGYYDYLINLVDYLDIKLNGMWSVQNPFGMGKDFRAIIRTDTDSYDDNDELVGRLLSEAMGLNMTHEWDENIFRLQEIERLLLKETKLCKGLITTLFDCSGSSQKVVLRINTPFKCASDHSYNSAIQSLLELQTAVKRPPVFGPMTAKNLTPILPIANNGLSFYNLPEDIFKTIASYVDQQEYNPAPFVCKLFYHHFGKNSVSIDMQSWRLAVPSENVNDFVRAAIWTELNKTKPDFDNFPTTLIRILLHHYAVLDVEELEAIPDPNLHDWDNMVTRLMDAFESSRILLDKVGLARLEQKPSRHESTEDELSDSDDHQLDGSEELNNDENASDD